jgi:hypothetical protein
MRPLLELKLRLRNDPLLFRTFWKRQERSYAKRRVVRPGDVAVIEGYPRSANTFATYAFIRCTGATEIQFGNHFHSPAQFALARRYGVPAMLVLREPVAAAMSMVVFDGKMDADEALRRYIAFHRPLIAIADSLVVAPFEEVTTDFGKSIDRLNARFGTRFPRFVHDEANERAVFDEIEAERARRGSMAGESPADPLKNTLPTPEKEAKRKQISSSFDAPALAPLRVEAESLYRSLRGRV